MNLERALKKAIRESGESLYAISQSAGVSYSTLWNFCHRGQDIRLSSIQRLGEHFQLELQRKKAKR